MSPSWRFCNSDYQRLFSIAVLFSLFFSLPPSYQIGVNPTPPPPFFWQQGTWGKAKRQGCCSLTLNVSAAPQFTIKPGENNSRHQRADTHSSLPQRTTEERDKGERREREFKRIKNSGKSNICWIHSLPLCWRFLGVSAASSSSDRNDWWIQFWKLFFITQRQWQHHAQSHPDCLSEHLCLALGKIFTTLQAQQPFILRAEWESGVKVGTLHLTQTGKSTCRASASVTGRTNHLEMVCVRTCRWVSHNQASIEFFTEHKEKPIPIICAGRKCLLFI